MSAEVGTAQVRCEYEFVVGGFMMCGVVLSVLGFGGKPECMRSFA